MNVSFNHFQIGGHTAHPIHTLGMCYGLLDLSRLIHQPQKDYVTLHYLDLDIGGFNILIPDELALDFGHQTQIVGRAAMIPLFFARKWPVTDFTPATCSASAMALTF